MHHAGKAQQTKKPVPQKVAGKASTATSEHNTDAMGSASHTSSCAQPERSSLALSSDCSKPPVQPKKKVFARVKELCTDTSGNLLTPGQLFKQKNWIGKNQNDASGEKKFLGSGFASFLLGLFVYLVLLVGLFLMLAQVFAYGVLVILLSVLMAFASILLAFIAISRKISDEEKYYGVGFAIAGLFLSGLFIYIFLRAYLSLF